MPTAVRRMLLFAPPALLSIVNFRHPILTAPIYRSVSPHMPWWSTLHLLNLGLFAVLGLAVYLLLAGVHNAAATLSRVALALFVPLYCAFDALAGLGTGLLARLASRLPSDQAGVAESLIDRYWSSGTINGLSVAGSIAWVIALLSAAVAATAPERRRPAAIAAVAIFLAGGWARTPFHRSRRNERDAGLVAHDPGLGCCHAGHCQAGSRDRLAHTGGSSFRGRPCSTHRSVGCAVFSRCSVTTRARPRRAPCRPLERGALSASRSPGMINAGCGTAARPRAFRWAGGSV